MTCGTWQEELPTSLTYQLYWGDMIQNWETDQLSKEDSEAEKWQQWLWKKTGIESRVTARDKVIAGLKENTELIRDYLKLPLRITIFTRFHLEFFKNFRSILKSNSSLSLNG